MTDLSVLTHFTYQRTVCRLFVHMLFSCNNSGLTYWYGLQFCIVAGASCLQPFATVLIIYFFNPFTIIWSSGLATIYVVYSLFVHLFLTVATMDSYCRHIARIDCDNQLFFGKTIVVLIGFIFVHPLIFIPRFPWFSSLEFLMQPFSSHLTVQAVIIHAYLVVTTVTHPLLRASTVATIYSSGRQLFNCLFYLSTPTHILIHLVIGPSQYDHSFSCFSVQFIKYLFSGKATVYNRFIVCFIFQHPLWRVQ